MLTPQIAAVASILDRLFGTVTIRQIRVEGKNLQTWIATFTGTPSPRDGWRAGGFVQRWLFFRNTTNGR